MYNIVDEKIIGIVSEFYVYYEKIILLVLQTEVL